MAESENPSVTFTVKELLGRMDAKLDKVITTLDSKASAADLLHLEQRVSVLESDDSREDAARKVREDLVASRKRMTHWVVGILAVAILNFVVALVEAIILN